MALQVWLPLNKSGADKNQGLANINIVNNARYEVSGKLGGCYKNGTINYCDEAKWTALHYACDEGCLKVVEILLKANCDVNVKTNTKKTPFCKSANGKVFFYLNLKFKPKI